ncbi:MAG: LUD domain-containing protein [Sphingobacteriales bacterium]|nr:LUD domain-containing protein [Sphingobacteriales bacterium]
MEVRSPKENILKKIRQALANPVPLPFPESDGNQPIFHKSEEDLSILFAQQFSSLQGKFQFVKNQHELIEQFQQLVQIKSWKKIYCKEPKLLPLLTELNITPFENLADCDISVTSCKNLIARTGSILLSSEQEMGRTSSVYAPIHICIAFTNQVVFDLQDVFNSIKSTPSSQLPSLLTFASGPSRTADIEKTLVTGVHGPKEVFCFLVED